MKNIKELVKNNKGLSILVLLGILLLIVIGIILFQFLKEKNSSKYGARLDGIEDVKISKKKITDIENTIKENEIVEKANIRIQGKIVYINIMFKTDTDVDGAKELANNILEQFDDDELRFYDFSCFLVELDDKDDENDEFKITGNKHYKFNEFTYIRS